MTVSHKNCLSTGQQRRPGVMQLESNRFSVGKVSPFEMACFSLSSASRADLFNQNVVQ